MEAATAPVKDLTADSKSTMLAKVSPGQPEAAAFDGTQRMFRYQFAVF